MGYNEYNTSWIAEQLQLLGLNTADLDTVEIGSQQIHYAGNALPVGAYYGQHHQNEYKSFRCFDLQEAPCTVITDLSAPLPETEHNRTDLVLNLGTLEHVEPETGHYQGWKNVHDMTKVGGVIIHDLPRFGSWKTHCRYWYTEEFVNTLARQNGYQIFGLSRWWDKREGWGILCTFIKQENRPFMSFEEFHRMVPCDLSIPIPGGNNNPKQL